MALRAKADDSVKTERMKEGQAFEALLVVNQLQNATSWCEVVRPCSRALHVSSCDLSG